MSNSEEKNPSEYYQVFEQNTDLKEILDIIWTSKKILITFTMSVALFTLFYVLFLNNFYKSESVLVPTNYKNSSTLSDISGLASLAGISIDPGGNNSITETISIIQSREFIKHLLTFDEILPSIMAPKSYNKNNERIIFDSSLYNQKEGTWEKKPTYLEVHNRYISEMLTIEEDQRTGLIKISIEHISPVFAKNFLSLIISEANFLKRKKDIDISKKALNFLERELSNTNLIDIKQSINQLIKAELQKTMMANINEEYSLSIIEPPFIPEDKSRPSRALIVLIATFLAFILCSFYIYIRHFLFLKES